MCLKFRVFESFPCLLSYLTSVRFMWAIGKCLGRPWIAEWAGNKEVLNMKVINVP